MSVGYIIDPNKIQYNVLHDGRYKFLYTNFSGQLIWRGG